MLVVLIRIQLPENCNGFRNNCIHFYYCNKFEPSLYSQDEKSDQAIHFFQSPICNMAVSQ